MDRMTDACENIDGSGITGQEQLIRSQIVSKVLLQIKQKFELIYAL